MPDPRSLPFHPSDLHGLSRLAVDGVIGVTDLVEHLHAAVATTVSRTVTRPFRTGGGKGSGDATDSESGASALPERTGGLTGGIYRSIRGITRLVGGGIDLVLAPLERLPEPARASAREHALAVLNGVLGDHLAATGNPLAIKTRLLYAGRPLNPVGPIVIDENVDKNVDKKATDHLVVFLHGLCLHPGHWTPGPDAEIEALPGRVDQQPGRTALELHYNSGRAIHENGRDLADALDDLHARWPIPIQRLSLVGHSMGGLVARSAAHYGHVDGRAWTEVLDHIITLGSPHSGAPLERAGHRFESLLGATPFTRPFKRVGGIRSQGIIDLRHGRVTEDGTLPILPPGARLHLLAASRSRAEAADHTGDGLVPVESALGHGLDETDTPIIRHRIHECGHLGLLHHPEAAELVMQWLVPETEGPRTEAPETRV